jgi:hypothetical protein
LKNTDGKSIASKIIEADIKKFEEELMKHIGGSYVYIKPRKFIVLGE